MLTALILFAQDAKEKTGQDFGPLSNPLVPMVVIMGLFFFLIILPAQRREKRQREEMASKLKKNDEVVTTAGIIGVVHTIKDGDEVIIKSDEGRIRVLKSSIVRIIAKEAPTDGAKP